MNAYNLFCIITTLCTVRGGREYPIVFPGSDNKSPREIPLELALRINDVQDYSQLFNNNMEDPEGKGPILSARFGGVERKALRIAKQATCEPELQTIRLQPSNDPTTLYIPSCTRVKRCGGCCNHDLLSCQPTQTEILQLGVIVGQYFGGGKLTRKQRDIVSVEQHTKCKCDCRIKEADCNPYQLYSKDRCRCFCKNKDKEEKCFQEADKLWDENECACVCKDTKECSTGFYFDKYSCTCLEARPRRSNETRVDIDRFNYNVD